jgi:hypothetical protein
MKTLTTTTPGNLFNLEGRLIEVDDHSGTFWAKADSILESVSGRGAEIKESPTNWADIMMNDRNGKLYAVWATDELTCNDGLLQYIELDQEDCPEAFEMSKDKIVQE